MHIADEPCTINSANAESKMSQARFVQSACFFCPQNFNKDVILSITKKIEFFTLSVTSLRRARKGHLQCPLGQNMDVFLDETLCQWPKVAARVLPNRAATSSCLA